MLTAIFISCAAAYVLAYFTYGRFLDRQYGVDDSRPTPSHADYDGVDRVPAHRAVLFGHHFSSIAGAGPIVGPIIAATAFGWLAPLLWVLLAGIAAIAALVVAARWVLITEEGTAWLVARAPMVTEVRGVQGARPR